MLTTRLASRARPDSPGPKSRPVRSHCAVRGHRRVCVLTTHIRRFLPAPRLLLSVLAVLVALPVSAVTTEGPLAVVRAGVRHGRGCGAPRLAAPPEPCRRCGRSARQGPTWVQPTSRLRPAWSWAVPRMAVDHAHTVRAGHGRCAVGPRPRIRPIDLRIVLLFSEYIQILSKFKNLCRIHLNLENYETNFVG
jgi:hypothetical protein